MISLYAIWTSFSKSIHIMHWLTMLLSNYFTSALGSPASNASIENWLSAILLTDWRTECYWRTIAGKLLIFQVGVWRMTATTGRGDSLLYAICHVSREMHQQIKFYSWPHVVLKSDTYKSIWFTVYSADNNGILWKWLMQLDSSCNCRKTSGVSHWLSAEHIPNSN